MLSIVRTINVYVKEFQELDIEAGLYFIFTYICKTGSSCLRRSSRKDEDALIFRVKSMYFGSSCKKF